jgi:hypothetical protein
MACVDYSVFQVQQSGWVKLTKIKQISDSIQILLDSTELQVAPASVVDDDFCSEESLNATYNHLSQESQIEASLRSKKRELASLAQQHRLSPFVRVLDKDDRNEALRGVYNELTKAERTLLKLKSLQTEMLEAEDDYLAILDQQWRAQEGTASATWLRPILPALPSGNAPIHAVFLMGLRHVGKRLIERYYDTPARLSEPVGSDLDPWRLRRSRRAGDWEDGLYTGESVLHIAIVQVRLAPRKK